MITFRNIFFPARCVGCYSFDTWLCQACMMRIFQPQHVQLHDARIASLTTLGPYRHPTMKTLLHTMKFSRIPEIARLCGQALALILDQQVQHTRVMVVPIPLHRRRARVRGFDQAHCLASTIASTLHVPLGDSLITRKRATTPQAQLQQVAARTTNMEGSFALNTHNSLQPSLKGWTMLLCDDVVTSGATLRAAACALSALDPKAIHGIAIARGH